MKNLLQEEIKRRLNSDDARKTRKTGIEDLDLPKATEHYEDLKRGVCFRSHCSRKTQPFYNGSLCFNFDDNDNSDDDDSISLGHLQAVDPCEQVDKTSESINYGCFLIGRLSASGRGYGSMDFVR
jgi:hypothetical protein